MGEGRPPRVPTNPLAITPAIFAYAVKSKGFACKTQPSKDLLYRQKQSNSVRFAECPLFSASASAYRINRCIAIYLHGRLGACAAATRAHRRRLRRTPTALTQGARGCIPRAPPRLARPSCAPCQFAPRNAIISAAQKFFSAAERDHFRGAKIFLRGGTRSLPPRKIRQPRRLGRNSRWEHRKRPGTLQRISPFGRLLCSVSGDVYCQP